MYLSSEMNLTLSQAEAKKLWTFLNSRYAEIDDSLAVLTRRIESALWDRLSIDEIAELDRSAFEATRE